MYSGLYVGLMSGTSMDMVDAVLTDISPTSITVRHQTSSPIPALLRERLERALESTRLAALECWRLDAEVGELFALSVTRLLESAGVNGSEVVAIGSHGQTIYHAPDDRPALTIQIGDPNIIASRTGIPVVADFRRMDIAAGGQGAPLAPLFHHAAFAGSGQRALLNLGGIANVTILPDPGEGHILGFDTGPANTLLDLWCASHLGQAFDAGGSWAATGAVDARLLERLLADPYFSRDPPKSTGRELFNRRWLDAALQDLPPLPPVDVQRTLVELTASTIASALTRHSRGVRELSVCGGGALNQFLMQRLSALLPGCQVRSTEALGIPPLAVEGAAFAWLAHQRMNGVAAGRPSVTGAAREATLGGLFLP